ncbi:MBL fold metallo-hydrolase [Rhizobium sp. KVB221]|uniref:MBL fold metallo-hydrolase n=1 Tax=Rhizobium setariae TaxID=2801340 RepID=A0A936YNT5_9HYPH|nr:MBL fold metallo-hydrolase [Rhizobium setariae]MBL0372903.1 MBL fold metallo-hydrolase [Rhizobium setariae]
MMGRRRFTILGCASSPGVPRITGDWGACDPNNPKNRRSRTALLVEQFAEDGSVTSVAIDTGPDFRSQMIAVAATDLHAVVLTHAHADHLHGIDDVRSFVYKNQHRMPVWGDALTMERVLEGFRYCFETPEGSSYPPICRSKIIPDLEGIFEVDGPGGAIPFLPVWQQHGDSHSLGFRIGDFAYCTDVSDFPDASVEKLKGLDTLVIDCLQYRRHPSHLSLEQAMGWIDRLQPKHAVLTHMHIPLDYDMVMRETPDHVEPAFDGMRIEIEY